MFGSAFLALLVAWWASFTPAERTQFESSFGGLANLLLVSVSPGFFGGIGEILDSLTEPVLIWVLRDDSDFGGVSLLVEDVPVLGECCVCTSWRECQGYFLVPGGY